MRIVVISDSHRDSSPLRRILLAQKDAEVFLHLGDGESDFADLSRCCPDKLMRSVRGNCDWGSSSKLIDLITCKGKRIFFTHGHSYSVKAGLSELVYAARGHKADVVLYGHTHTACTAFHEGMYLMNPGSVSQPRAGGASYGVVDITDAGIVTRIIRLERVP